MRTTFLSALLFASAFAASKEIIQHDADMDLAGNEPTATGSELPASMEQDMLPSIKSEENLPGSTHEENLPGSTREYYPSGSLNEENLPGSTHEQDDMLSGDEDLPGNVDEEESMLSEEDMLLGEPRELQDTEEDMQVDYSKLFTKGMCPEGIEGMKNLEYERLSGDWFLQRTDEAFIPEMLPSCHHCQLDVNEDGEFTAIEEMQIQGRAFILAGVTGEFAGSSMEVEFFGERMQVQFELLDTDYDNYMIGYECFDNMQFALENDVEPVHIITMGLATRNPNETPEKLAELETKVLNLLPFLTKEDLAPIKQGDAGECEYQIEF